MCKKNLFKLFLILLAVIIASFSFCISSSAADSPIYSANSLDDFLQLESDFATLDGKPLNLSWATDYSDSIPVPYIYGTGSSGTVSGKTLILHTSSLLGESSNFVDNTDYLVYFPVKFLVVGGVGYYPSSSFSLEVNYNDPTTYESKYITVSASDYNYTDSNRGHFSCVFSFVVPGYVLNNSTIFSFNGYRSVARSTPFRFSLSDLMTISVYNPDSDAAEQIIDNNNYNADRIIKNAKQQTDTVINGWSGDSLDGSKLDESEALENSVNNVQTEIILGFDDEGNAITTTGTINDLQKTQLTGLFESFRQYFNNPKTLMGVTNFLSRIMYIPGLSAIFIFSLALAVIPLVVGLGINAGRGSDRRASEAAREARRKKD